MPPHGFLCVSGSKISIITDSRFAQGPVFGGLDNAVDFLVDAQPELIAVPTSLQSIAEIVTFDFLCVCDSMCVFPLFLV